MKRQMEREQIHRLSVKTLDQVFMARACESLGCSMFEAQALTELVKEVYFSLADPTRGDTGGAISDGGGVSRRFAA